MPPDPHIGRSGLMDQQDALVTEMARRYVVKPPLKRYYDIFPYGARKRLSALTGVISPHRGIVLGADGEEAAWTR